MDQTKEKVEKTIERMNKRRRRRQVAAIFAVGLVALALVGLTALMYDSTPAEQPVGRIGTESILNLEQAER